MFSSRYKKTINIYELKKTTLYLELWQISSDIINKSKVTSLTISTLLINSANGKLIVFLFFLDNRIWDFMQIVSIGDNLHEMSNPVFLKN